MKNLPVKLLRSDVVNLLVLIGLLMVNYGVRAQSTHLFESDEPLPITLKGNLRDLLNDRVSDQPKNFQIDLILKNADSSEVAIPIQAKTRGHFRRLKENCYYPPLLLQFASGGIQEKTVFRDQIKLKLVMPCKGDEYTVKEWMVYKIYNLLTPQSFNARLVRITLDDLKAKKPGAPFYGILLEEDHQMAKRNQMITVEKKILPAQAQLKPFLTMAVFEYMIGNTDWSLQYLQNIKLIAQDSTSKALTVPYDFDHAGLVNAPYAQPAVELQLSSVRERRYRGYCIQALSVFDGVLTQFDGIKDKVYALYNSSKQLDAKTIKTSLLYLDEFYATIHDPKKWQKDFSYPCDKNGTGNVVIRGLKTD